MREVGTSRVKVEGLRHLFCEDGDGLPEITLEILDHRMHCGTRWSDGNLTGLKLASPLPDEIAERIRRTADS